MEQARDRATILSRLDAAHADVCEATSRMLALIAEAHATGAWKGSGARDLAHLVAMRYGMSVWKAQRWVAAALALPRLPRIAEALASGRLRIDKVAELTRFAAPSTEPALIRWAEGVSSGAVRRRADLETSRERSEAADPERGRRLAWWWTDEGRRLGLEAELPAAPGAVVLRALEGLAREVPVLPGEEGEAGLAARRADALVLLAAGKRAPAPTVVVHASVEALSSDTSSCSLEGGGVVHAETARRLACTARVQAIVEDGAGNPVRMGRTTREPTAWMLRHLLHRDGECRFPGCGARRFTEAHHVVWWGRGGRTDLDNLVLVCGFHHRLVHELGWSIALDDDGSVRWFLPDGRPHRPGPAPPIRAAAIAG